MEPLGLNGLERILNTSWLERRARVLLIASSGTSVVQDALTELLRFLSQGVAAPFGSGVCAGLESTWLGALRS